jgi:hypothetical protein
MFDGSDYEPEMASCPECGDSFKPGAGLAAHRRLRHGLSTSQTTKRDSQAKTEPEKDIANGIKRIATNIDQPEIADAIERRAENIADALVSVFKATDVGDSLISKVSGEDSKVKIALIHLGITVAPILGVAILTVVLPRVWPRRRPLLASNGEPIVDLDSGYPLAYSKDGSIWLKGKVIGNLDDQPQSQPTSA